MNPNQKTSLQAATHLPNARPYWWIGAGLPDAKLNDGPDALPDKIATLVIGAGYTGLIAALTLARAGREVVVVDAENIGHGCSSRNGGQFGPSLHKLGVAGLSDIFGANKANAILRESMSSLDFLKSFVAQEGIDCDMMPDKGRFKGASRPTDYDTIARECAALGKAVGLEFEMVPKVNQSTWIGSDFYHGGVYYPKDGMLDPAKYVTGLAHLAKAAGARLIAPARASQIQRDGDGFRLNIAGRKIRARQILIATNGYSGPELPFFNKRVMPMRSAIIATEELPRDLVSSCFPSGTGVVDSSRLVLYYRPSPDGRRVVFGGRSFTRQDRPDKYAPDLSRLMHRIFPQLKQAKITHAWSGTVGYTFDYTPHLGNQDGLYYSMGYCGSGVGRASFFGHKIALKMLGKKGGETALDGLTFPTKLGYNGTPWMLPMVLRWHSLLDRIGR